MKIPKRPTLVIGGLLLAFLTAAFLFVFNPFGLGPEPESVLTPDFFANPVQDLSALELLVDGEEDLLALTAILCAPENSLVIYGQPHEGIVVINVTEKTREKTRRIVDTMELSSKS